MGNQVVARVKKTTGVEPAALPFDAFPAYSRLIQAQPYRHRPLANLFGVIVTETLISSTLSRIPHDKTVHPLVRWYTAEHAVDEGRHHAYFAQVLHHTWPKLTKSQQLAMGRLVPKLIKTFLSPDLASISADLRSVGCGVPEIDQIIGECVTTVAAVDGIRQAANQSSNHFRRAGALEVGSICDAFEDEGLL